MLSPIVSPEQRRAIIAALLEEDFETLPPYKLALFADVVNETLIEIGAVVLVTPWKPMRRKPRASCRTHRRVSVSPVTQRSFGETLVERQVEVRDVLPSEFYTTVRLNFAVPKPTPEAGELTERAGALMYQLLLRAFAQRDLGWLSILSRADLEALAGN